MVSCNLVTFDYNLITEMQTRMIDRFSRDFDENKSDELTPEQTFEKAVKKFEETCGFTPYSNYQSYRVAKYQDRRKRFR